jgi:LemA protein
MFLYFVLAIIAIIIVWVIIVYNGFIRIRNSIEEAFSTMDIYLKKRFDIIPNLISTVKGYIKHESQTLINVVNARNDAIASKDTDSRMESENAITGSLSKLFALAERYPDLRADSQFLDLQNQLVNIENDIAQSRKYYNAVVKQFNTKSEVFPSSIIAAIFSFKRRNYFEVSNNKERENVKVDFNE